MNISKSICFKVITEEQRQHVQAIGISGMICVFVLLLPILVLEARYIFGHGSNFLLRLFFYMTLSATLLDAVYGSYTITQVDFKWTCSITDYALYVQVILVLAINFVLLTMMYMQVHTRCQNVLYEQHLLCLSKSQRSDIFSVPICSPDNCSYN